MDEIVLTVANGAVLPFQTQPCLLWLVVADCCWALISSFGIGPLLHVTCREGMQTIVRVLKSFIATLSFEGSRTTIQYVVTPLWQRLPCFVLYALWQNFAWQNSRRCSALITVECLAYFFAYGISRSLRLRGRASLLRIEINGIVNAVNYN
jgi:hypothetical protein